jgi:hypothetical protein
VRINTAPNEYKIETVGSQFIVVDPWDEIVGRYASEEEAQRNIEAARRDIQLQKLHTY